MEAYPYTWIDTDLSLAQCCESVRAANVVAIDTEFMRSTTFYPKAALFQINDGQHNYLIDPLTIANFQPLVHLLSDDTVTKVFHSCSEDLEVIQYFLNCVPAPLIDTQIAAALLNIGSAVGYGNLVKHLLNKDLDKGETRSDWLQRPLQARQITYAVQDVAYLLPVYEKLMDELRALGREEWLRQECQVLVNSARQVVPIDDYYLKVKSAWKLNRRQLAALKAMCTWREKKARVLDMPRNHIVPAKALMELAQMQPANTDELKRVEDLSRRQRHQFGDEIVELIETVQALSEDDCPPLFERPLSPQQKQLARALKELAETIAEKHQLPVEVLAKKQDIEDLVRSDRGGNFQLPARLRGWRELVIGQALLDKANNWQ